ncbi:MAG: hypothetical protein LBU75_08825 [Desulfovibrio sp.]|jgi:hypothetical protein|nr:hypothetical protein [Desulfovibrio sp.]
MLWQPVSFTPPASIGAVGDGLSGSLGTVGSTVASGAASLAGLGLPEGPPPAGGGTADLRNDASGMLASPCPYIAVTPYQQGVGQRRGDRAYLTPQGAVSAVAGRMSEAQDLQAPGALPASTAPTEMDTAMVLLVMAAPDESGLATSLGRFNGVFPITELQQAQRRAGGLAGLERDKFTIPPAPGYPAWGASSPQRGGPGLATSRALGGQLAMAEGLSAASTSPVGRLGAFGAKRQTAMAARQADLDALRGSMTGSDPGWSGVYLEGQAVELAKLLVKFAPPMDAAFKCCAAVCWYGTKRQVAYYKEAFGLENPLEGIA